ncbi:MAG: adenylate/guanylate cyclase domain-containing protein [Reyranellaceae bacterium]
MAIFSRSIPFSVGILLMTALVVVPLSSALLWLGWRSVDLLEQRSVDHRMTTLEGAVSNFLGSGLRAIVSVGMTLTNQPAFSATAGPAADNERRRQLVDLLERHPAVEAAFVGYDDGRFFYAGRLSLLSIAQRQEFDAPDADAIIVRSVEAGPGTRPETWWFVLPGGASTPPRVHPTSFDPRQRPWYIDATGRKAATLTEPYRFAWADDVGISAGLPFHGGVLGFDFSLDTLDELITRYKITPNAIVMASPGNPETLIGSEPCRPADPDCFKQDVLARQALRQLIVEASAEGGRAEREVTLDGRDYRLLVRPMPALLGRTFLIGVAVPDEELSATSKALLQRAAAIAAAALAIAALAVLGVSLLMSRAVRRIAQRTERIRNLDFSDLEPVPSSITEIRQLSNSVENMRQGLQLFGRYVSKDLVAQIMRSPESAGVGGEQRELTVMFTDVEGFSFISENIDPKLLTSRLSRYFEVLGAAITNHRGMIDKYIGDGIMAFWNAPALDPDHVTNAVRAALEAADASRRLEVKWRDRGRPGFRTRFGLHTGPAVVGNVGARERLNYTLVGAVANQASRLEGLNKVYGTEILASGEVQEETRTRFVWRHVDRVIAVGTTGVLELWQPLGPLPDEGYDEFLKAWEQGKDSYRGRRFAYAARHFERALALRPGDGPCQVFIERCRTFAEHGAPKDWDGVWRPDQK